MTTTPPPIDDPHATTVSVVINFFNPQNLSRLNAMVTFAMECLAQNTYHKLELILSDGSGQETPVIRDLCRERGWIYTVAADKGAFARIYNHGMTLATGEFRVWMASDLFLPQHWDKRMVAEMRRTGAWMAAPYLTNSDYPGQVLNWVWKHRTFVPSLMTFNVNMITRHCWQTVGGMDDRFSGNFNDIDYMVRIRRAGGEAIICDAGQVCHLARATSSTSSSTFKYDQDLARFLERYPEFGATGGIWPHDLRPVEFSRNPRMAALTKFARVLPGPIGVRVGRLMMRSECLLSAV